MYRAGSTGIVAAAAAGSADLEDGPSGTGSGKHTPAAQRTITSRAAAAQGPKDAAAVSIQPAKKRKLLLCVVIPLLLVLSVAGIGLGVGLGISKNKHSTTAVTAAAAAKSDDRLAFKVTVAVPTDQPAVSCAKWFGSSQVRHPTVKHCAITVLSLC